MVDSGIRLVSPQAISLDLGFFSSTLVLQTRQHRSEGFPNGIFGPWARWTRAPPDVQSCLETVAVI